MLVLAAAAGSSRDAVSSLARDRRTRLTGDQPCNRGLPASLALATDFAPQPRHGSLTL
jgi:hypothetical protein